MKKDIHPTYNEKTIITCSCGNTFEVGSTNSDINVEICSNCHPFFTGKQKFIDTAGRIDRFKAKLEAKNSFVAKPVVKEDAKVEKIKTDKKEVVETAKVEEVTPETEVTEDKTAPTPESRDSEPLAEDQSIGEEKAPETVKEETDNK